MNPYGKHFHKDSISGLDKMPYIVVAIYEYADLMMYAGKEFELSLCKLAQFASSVGIHVIISTRMFEYNMITGSIKANFESRWCFNTAARMDSESILDCTDTVSLNPVGDSILAKGRSMFRVQPPHIKEEEIKRIVQYVNNQTEGFESYVLPKLKMKKQAYMEELIKQAEQGDARAQFQLGMAYCNGDRIEKSQEKAFEWWTKAAEQGVEFADYCLGCIHFEKKDFQTALEHYLKAISDPIINEVGFQLGVIYENGLGVEIDKDKAIEYYKKGAAGLNMSSHLSTDALKRLGVIHSWADLGFNHQELIEKVQYRYNEKWNDLIPSFSFLHSEIWLNIFRK